MLGDCSSIVASQICKAKVRQARVQEVRDNGQYRLSTFSFLSLHVTIWSFCKVFEPSSCK